MKYLNYSITLVDCNGVSPQDRKTATELYCAAIEKSIGAGNCVATAYKRYQAILNKYEELPLPKDAHKQEHEIVDTWEKANSEGVDAAFDGWHCFPDAAHFEIFVD